MFMETPLDKGNDNIFIYWLDFYTVIIAYI